QTVGGLIVGMGKSRRPERFTVALTRLALNLGDVGEQFLMLLGAHGYSNLQRVALAQSDHIRRSLVYFQNALTKKGKPATFNVNKLLSDAALAACPYRKPFMSAGNERLVQVSFKEKLDQEAPEMAGGEEALYLALYQIVANAVTAVKGSGGTVSLYTKYFERFRQLQITVADTGAGIDRAGVLKSALETETVNPLKAGEIRADKNDLNNKVFKLIFKPQVSVFAFLKDENHMGLGLTLAHEEITGHKGRIEIHSKPGKGTTFQVFFYIR
ncbi:MAG: ATP-binding protein, partial [Gemmatimonadota bacterium]|nr:ATP-binding protein [Gemmatimonadota bacterium]